MKKTNITIQYDEEKLTTLNVYLTDKKIDLNDEISKMIDSLYNKHVPPAVRDFFDKKSGVVSARRSSHNDRTQPIKNPPREQTGAQN